jgi:hypothetical protein
MPPKPGPKKSISKVKIYDDTQGTHRLSADVSELFIGGSKFKRKVLPSVASPRAEDQRLNSDLEDLDKLTIKETGSDDT